MSEKGNVAAQSIVHTVKVRLSNKQLETVRIAAAMQSLRASEYLRQAGLATAQALIEARLRTSGDS